MNVCVIILKEEELYDDLIHRFREEKMKNLTVMESVALKTNKKERKKEIPLFSTLRYMMDYIDDESYRIEIIGEKEELLKAQAILKDLVPVHQYLSYIMPIEHIEGTLE